MSCEKVVLFYESHNDKNPAKTIMSLSKILKQNDIKSYCFEEPSDETKEELLEIYRKGINQYHYFVDNIASISDQLIESFLFSNIISPSKGNLIDQAEKFLVEMANSLEVTMKLIESTEQNHVNFCTMDMPRSMRNFVTDKDDYLEHDIRPRDKYMSEKILEECNEKGNILALVGASHLGIADILREKNIHVKEYYVTSNEVEINGPDIGDLCLRVDPNQQVCAGHIFDGLVIDLHSNPDLDAVQLIAADLGYFHDEL